MLILVGCRTTDKDNYGLEVIYDVEVYHKMIKSDSNKRLVDLEQYIPGIILDIRYATDNNFTGEVIYEEAKAYVRLPVAKVIKQIQEQLNDMGLGLKVFDAYRPYAATLRFYEVYPDTMFVAAPWKGSRHNRGCAVDVGLVDLKTGNELPMPTAFDDFTEKAHAGYSDLADTLISNRTILINIMEKNGFSVYPYEWWHYDFTGWENYELMDIALNEINSIK